MATESRKDHGFFFTYGSAFVIMNLVIDKPFKVTLKLLIPRSSFHNTNFNDAHGLYPDIRLPDE